MQQIKRQDHPYKAAISNIIIAINEKVKERHEIILSIDSSDQFTNVTAGLAKLCRECKLFDLLDHIHGTTSHVKSYLRIFQKSDFIFCP